jgi:hypothetical protein
MTTVYRVRAPAASTAPGDQLFSSVSICPQNIITIMINVISFLIQRQEIALSASL